MAVLSNKWLPGWGSWLIRFMWNWGFGASIVLSLWPALVVCFGLGTDNLMTNGWNSPKPLSVIVKSVWDKRLSQTARWQHFQGINNTKIAFVELWPPVQSWPWCEEEAVRTAERYNHCLETQLYTAHVSQDAQQQNPSNWSTDLKNEPF